MIRSDFPAPQEGFVVAHFITVEDKRVSTKFYTEVLPGSLVRVGGDDGVNIVRLANTWIVIHLRETPTPDKPGITLEPPSNLSKINSFLEIRVANFQESYNLLKNRGAKFLSEPNDRGGEIRCFMRDPDGYLIEIGEATGILNEMSEE
jgi:catechol 2,3-dioxygenase-like lactoylglutathione lyase family enzyme